MDQIPAWGFVSSPNILIKQVALFHTVKYYKLKVSLLRALSQTHNKTFIALRCLTLPYFPIVTVVYINEILDVDFLQLVGF